MSASKQPSEESMAEEEEPQPPMNHIRMTHTCTACDDDCETACKDGTCRLIRKA